MASHFHLDNNNTTLVNNHENIRLNSASPPAPTPHNSQISVDNDVKNNQNNGGNIQQSPNFDSDIKSNFLGALKEWAVVCKALESGDQILLFRKGGIMEFRNGFELKFKDFFLFPTFEHQARESIRPEYHAVLNQIEKNNEMNEEVEKTTENNNSPTTKKYTEVTSFVNITHFGEVSNLDRLKALEDFHIWTDDYVKTRFNYNPKKPLYLLLLRTYKLKKSIKILNKPQWIGCKSWIQIDLHDQDLDLYFDNHTPENPFEYLKSISNPCIDDDKFNKLSEKVRSII